MSDSDQTFEQMCRACLCKNQSFHSLFDEAADRPLTIYEMFATTLPQLPVHSNDELSKLICVACLNTLIIVHKFQEMCIASDSYMRNMLANSRLSCKKAEQKDEIKHTPIAQEDIKVDYSSHIAADDPLELPIPIKVEAAEDYHDNEDKNSEWSDCDDRPLKDIAHSMGELQSCIKFEISEVKVQECDIKAFLNTKDVACNDKDMAVDLSVGTCRKIEFDDGKAVTASESDTDNGSEWIGDDDSDYQEKPKRKVRQTDQKQQPDTFNNTDVSREYEIEKPNSQPRRKYHFCCQQCNVGFTSNYKLKHHARVHLETSPFACEICSYRFKTTGALAQHINIAHELSPPEGHKCSKCPRRFEKRKSLVSHMSSHRDTLLKCKWCPRKFTKLKTLLQHVRIHPESSTASVSFISCREQESNAEYQERKSDHDDDFEWSADDDISYFPEKAPTNETNKANETNMDEIEKPNSRSRRKFNFYCPHCDAGFASDYKLKQHARLHLKTRAFACEICNYRFKTAKTLAYHNTLTHEMSNSEGFKCPECTRRFEKCESLVSHMKSHRQQLFKCNLCSKKFKKLKELLNHARTHPANQKYISDRDVGKKAAASACNAVVSNDQQDQSITEKNKTEKQESASSTNNEVNEKDMANDYKKEQQQTSASSIDNITDEQKIENLKTKKESGTSSDNSKTNQPIEKPYSQPRRKYHFRCQHCDAGFASDYKLKLHSHLHLESRQFACEICNYRYRTAKALALHKHTHETPPEDGFKCSNCPRRFEKLISLTSHLRNHRTTEPDEFFKCRSCPKKFKKLITLTQHERTHLEIQKYSCNLCEEAFELSTQLEDHINTNHGLKSLICEYCKKEFKNKSSLELHQRQHTDEKPFLCPQCGKSFRTNKTLSDHLLRHSGIKRYQCSECPSKFACDVDRRKHLLIHRGTKPHACDICGQKFSRHDSINKHKRSVHSDKRPYKCDECDMTFAILQHMHRHKRTHTGEKPYKCNYCEKAYADSGDLTKHLRLHVGEKTYTCEECPKKFKYFAELKEHKRLHYKQQQQKAVQEERKTLRRTRVKAGI